MANLGKDTDGSAYGLTHGVLSASQYEASASGTGTTIYLRAYRDATGGRIIPGIWADNGSNYPGTLLASGTAITLTTSEAEYSCALDATVTITSGTKYWLGSIGENVSAVAISRADTGGANYYIARTTFSLVDFPGGAASGTRAYDIYIPILAAASAVPLSLLRCHFIPPFLGGR